MLFMGCPVYLFLVVWKDAGQIDHYYRYYRCENYYIPSQLKGHMNIGVWRYELCYLISKQIYQALHADETEQYSCRNSDYRKKSAFVHGNHPSLLECGSCGFHYVIGQFSLSQGNGKRIVHQHPATYGNQNQNAYSYESYSTEIAGGFKVG